MKVDVRHAKVNGIQDGSSISIETGEDLVIAPGDKYVGIQTNNTSEFDDLDELWIFKRKAFLKAVAKALGVVIYEPASTAGGVEDSGYYR